MTSMGGRGIESRSYVRLSHSHCPALSTSVSVKQRGGPAGLRAGAERLIPIAENGYLYASRQHAQTLIKFGA